MHLQHIHMHSSNNPVTACCCNIRVHMQQVITEISPLLLLLLLFFWSCIWFLLLSDGTVYFYISNVLSYK